MDELRSFMGIKPISELPSIQAGLKTASDKMTLAGSVPGRQKFGESMDNIENMLDKIGLAGDDDSRGAAKEEAIANMGQFRNAIGYQVDKAKLMSEIVGLTYNTGYGQTPEIRTGVDITQMSNEDLEYN